MCSKTNTLYHLLSFYESRRCETEDHDTQEKKEKIVAFHHNVLLCNICLVLNWQQMKTEWASQNLFTFIWTKVEPFIDIEAVRTYDVIQGRRKV